MTFTPPMELEPKSTINYDHIFTAGAGNIYFIIYGYTEVTP